MKCVVVKEECKGNSRIVVGYCPGYKASDWMSLSCGYTKCLRDSCKSDVCQSQIPSSHQTQIAGRDANVS